MLLLSLLVLTGLEFAWATENVVKRATSPISIDMTSLSNFFYLANVSIGNPPQQLTVIIDTGSRDLVVVQSDSQACQAGNCTIGSFNESASNAFTDIADDLTVGFEGPSGGTGSWATDDIVLGGQTIQNMTFGLITSVNGPQNVLGLGYPDLPTFKDEPLNTTLQVLQSVGLISSPSLSVRLADPPNIVMGGIDTSAFVGSLTVYDIATGNGSILINGDPYDRYAIELESLSLNGSPLPIGSSSIRVVLDTGAPIIQVPPAVSNALWSKYNVKPVPGSSFAALVSCSSLANSTDIFTVGLPGFNVDIPVSELVMQPTAQFLQVFGSGITLPPDTCAFLVGPQTDLKRFAYILGSPFLRKVYAVFDQHNQQIALGRLSQGSGSKTSIVEIPLGNNVLASISSNPTATAPTPTSSGKGNKSAAYRVSIDSKLFLVVFASIAAILA